MIVMINSPSANGYYGNVVAGSIFKEVADKVYSLNLNMHKSVNEVLASHNSLPVISKGTASDLKNIYDFLGTGTNSVDGEWAIARPNGNSVLLAQNEINGGTIPDVTGMSLKDALYLLESMGLNVKVNGKGTVISQSLVGEKISKGTQITIELR
jgi:cell division protein FtsI (penicillin-binding protein 3)